jgi:hypothetical protein
MIGLPIRSPFRKRDRDGGSGHMVADSPENPGPVQRFPWGPPHAARVAVPAEIARRVTPSLRPGAQPRNEETHVQLLS